MFDAFHRVYPLGGVDKMGEMKSTVRSMTSSSAKEIRVKPTLIASPVGVREVTWKAAALTSIPASLLTSGLSVTAVRGLAFAVFCTPGVCRRYERLRFGHAGDPTCFVWVWRELRTN